jgi:dTDP-4-amino-4,6-dideoxygalactose transaminase
LAAAVRRGLEPLRAVSLAPEPPRTRGVYWFLRLRVEAAKLRVDKQTFARAVAAEGLPVEPRYSQPVSRAPWFAGRRTYGRSGCPWTCPRYRGDPRRDFPCPNAQEAADSHFVIYFHEGYGAREVRDIVAALTKVEKAYLA